MKSPLKSKPLRNPGQSLDKEIEDTIYDQYLAYVMAASFAVVLAALEWWRWYKSLPYSPIVFTLVALGAAGLALYKFILVKKRVQQLRLGRDGERVVGQYLEELRGDGAEVLHDVLGDNFNLDHVVIHRSGIYVIETKTFSKPIKGRPRLVYDGETISNSQIKIDRNPVLQVRAAQRWLKDLLTESTGRKFPYRAVVVFPGWFIEPTAEAKQSDVWVLNPKALRSFISMSAHHLSPEDVKLCSFHLRRYIRSVENSK